MAKNRRVDIKAILGDSDLRRKLMVSTIRATQAREGIETTEEQADRAYYVVTEAERTAFFALEPFRGGKRGRRDERHETFVRALRHATSDVRHDVARRDFAAIDGSPLAYLRVRIIAPVFRESPALDPAVGIAAQGLATAADGRFVRYFWEVPAHAQGHGRPWVAFAKGGPFSRFYADVFLVVNWRENGADIRALGKGRVQNDQYYFKPGMTWPLRTQRGFNLRMLPEGCIFGHKGPAILDIDPRKALYVLGIANSAPAEFILSGLMSFGSWEVGVVKRLPIPKASVEQMQRISRLTQSIYDTKRRWDTGNEVATSFVCPWVLQARNARSFSETLVSAHAAEEEGEEQIEAMYSDLNEESYRLYGIADEKRALIEAALGERAPEILWADMERRTAEQKRMEHVWRLLSYMVKRVLEADEDGIVPFQSLIGDAGLLDRIHNEVATLFPNQDANQVEVEITNELKRVVKGYKRASSIGEWLEDVFFDYHASLYKKRPIIWHIASSQGRAPQGFGVLCHYHRFDANRMAKLRAGYLREAIETFRREAALANQSGHAEARIEWQAKLEETLALDSKLQAVQEGRFEGPEGGATDYRILTPWKAPEDRPKGWAPDIDDGVKVNIEPLQKAGVLRIRRVV
ncbi:MAG: hypothetical protein F4Y86_00755 [Gammaproteobacteria bacterium]|nr:hypothetical protein [Gammaproteobacteria bacterium]